MSKFLTQSRKRFLSKSFSILAAIFLFANPFLTIFASQAFASENPVSYPEAEIEEPVAESTEEKEEIVDVPTWTASNGGYVTTEAVKLGETYVAPQNSKVTLKFTSLPETPEPIEIKEIILSEEQKTQLGADSRLAYEITTEMQNGTFTYDLTLPNYSASETEVVYSQTSATLESSTKVTETSTDLGDTIKVSGLDHFTVFWVRENNYTTDRVVQVNIPNTASDVRFVVDGVDLTFHEVVTDADWSNNSYDNDIYTVSGGAAGYTRFRMQKALTGGEYTITAEYFDSGVWNTLPTTDTTYSIDKPDFSWVIPSTSGLYYRPGDNPLRARIDDEYSQFTYIQFEIWSYDISLASWGSVVGTYQTDRANCDLRQAGNYVLCDANDSSGWSNLPEGEYRARVKTSTVPNTGVRTHESAYWSEAFTVDGTKPVVNSLTITDPVAMAADESVTLQANATDNNAVEQVTFSVTAPRVSDGQCDPTEPQVLSSQIETTVVSADTYETTFDVSGLPDGEYCFFASARDIAKSNSNPNAAKVSTLVDHSAPAVQAVKVKANYDPYVKGNSFKIQMKANDANGIAGCEYTIDGSTWFPATYNLAKDQCEIAGLSVADGATVTANMRATDNAGRTSTGSAVIRTADSLAPIITTDTTITPLISGHTGESFTVFANFTDTVSPITDCQYRTALNGSSWSAYLDGVLTVGANPLDATCSADLSGYSDDDVVKVQIRVKDSVKFATKTSATTVTVDKEVPNTASFTSPADDSSWSSAITLSGNSTDNVGVDFVELYISPASAATGQR